MQETILFLNHKTNLSKRLINTQTFKNSHYIKIETKKYNVKTYT